MNNSLERLLDGMATALRRDVIPRLDDEYATGQALAVIDLINSLKLRLDWAVPPLLAHVESQRLLVAELDRLLADFPERPQLDGVFDVLPPDGRSLQALCDRIDGFIGATVRWMGNQPASPMAAAQTAISAHIRSELRRDMALTPRPLFAEIARGNDAAS
ncbi:MAG: hypothetical protein JWP52_1064 [Rhizobacter sp.]|jgi:hypothetical protein|nr:hypothetical protein [Rhizobacter sp.]